MSVRQSFRDIPDREIENLPALTAYLSQFVTDNKKKKVAKVLEDRTRDVTVVLEDIYKSHNASAVLRTCDLLGLQDVHVIENEHRYNFNAHVLRGSANWLTIKRYREKNNTNTIECLRSLKQEGYKIYVTSLDPISKPFQQCTYDQRSALVMGTEYLGVSKEALSMADELIHIPMHGFTESFNVSVSAAIILSDMIPKIKNNIPQWSLTKSEKDLLTYRWYRSIVKNVDKHIDLFLKS